MSNSFAGVIVGDTDNQNVKVAQDANKMVGE
jgi:hypothetical protein